MFTTDLSQVAASPPAPKGGRYEATLIPGDGIGPQLLEHVRQVFVKAAVPVDFEIVNINSHTSDDKEVMKAIASLQKNGVGLKGNIQTDHSQPPNHKSKNLLLRTKLDLFANVIHHKCLPGVKTRHSGIDIVIIRENTEGEYSWLEHESVPGVVESLRIITRSKSHRIAQYAFEHARKHGRKKVTAVHKANIMKLADGLFLECCREVASGFPDIKFEQLIVDNTTMQLVSRPTQFDVMVMPNLYGNVVNSVCAGLVGGSGLVAGANYGTKCAIFESGTRNTGKSLVNKDIANPTAMLLASCLMLDYLGLKEHSNIIRKAIMRTMGELNIRTFDIGGSASTQEVINSILHQIK
ncbi:Isocitrate dehydrogenase [NAD] subunit gamma, mitochondrial [Acipenser ruthenus]|uniref:Isocitrate dehydrogenase [NAD] subunit gamma, mitochondrial n=1 Tax=Acipenser ruthenus TaxID=7906 RepID=A0A444UA13_ACIRT|nr:Isocitrate dehydrogenase [NAD] subunit gamma, mitochondrial [Acipenser ruthenus]